MFKYNKITAFWAAGVAASLFGGPALAAEEKLESALTRDERAKLMEILVKLLATAENYA